MKSFKDRTGREWNVTVDLGAARRVRDIAKFTLLNLDVWAMLKPLEADLILLVDVLYAICKPQADELKISDEEFGKLMGAAELEAAEMAILRETIDFFQKSREANLKILAAVEGAQPKVQAKAMEQLDQSLSEFESSLENKLNSSVGSSAASSE